MRGGASRAVLVAARRTGRHRPTGNEGDPLKRRVLGLLDVLRAASHVRVTMSAWGSRFASGICQILLVRVLITGLGNTHYALFTVVLSLINWFALADGGLGSSVQNAISHARARGEPRAVLLRSAAALGLILFVVSFAIDIAAGPVLQSMLFRKLSGVDTLPGNIVTMSGAILILSAMGTVAYRIYYAELRGELANLYLGAGSVLGLLCVWLVNRHEAGHARLDWSLAAWLGPAALMGLIAAMLLGRDAAVRAARADWSVVRSLWSRSWRFWGFAVLSAATLNLDYVIMSQLLRADEIVQYNVVARVYSLTFFLYTSLLQATWPLFTEAFARSDFATVQRLTRQNLRTGAGIILACTALLVVLRRPVSAALLAHSNIVLSAGIIGVFGALHLIRVWCDTCTVMLLSQNRLRVLWAYIPAQALISVGAQVLLARRLGIYGIPLGIIVSYLATAVWVLPLALRRRPPALIPMSVT